MVGAKTGMATHLNEIESHAHLTHCNGHTLQLSETIKAVKITRGTPDGAFELNKLKNTLWFENHRKKIKAL